MNKKASRREKTSVARSVLIFIITEACIIPLFSFFSAIILSTLSDPLRAVGFASVAVIILCGAIGGFVISRLNRDNATLPVVIGALSTSAILLLIGLAVAGGSVGGMLLLNIAIFIICAMLASCKRRKHRRHF